MSNVATASINSFGTTEPKADFVPPSEGPVFVLTGSQLQDLITQAVEKAIQPLQDRIEALEATVARQCEQIAALQATQDTLGENLFIQLKLIGQLREAAQKTVAAPAPPRGEKTLARLAKIDEILKTRGPTTLKELERILKIRPQEMSRIMARLDKRRYEIFLRAGDDREKVLRLKVQIR
jgi:transcription initiation factor IIE alpha subunit